MQRLDSLSYIYFANQKGEFIGIEQLPDGQMVVHIRDASTAAKRNTYILDGKGNQTDYLIASREYDPRLSSWYNTALRLGKPTWSPIYRFAASGYTTVGITPVMPLYSPKGKPQGVLASDMSLAQISNFLRGLKISPNGKAIIIEPSGEIVATSTNQSPFILQNLVPKRLRIVDSEDLLIQAIGKHLLQEYGDFEQIENLSSSLRINDRQQKFLQVKRLQDGRGLDWLIIVTIPETDFTERIDANTRTTIWLCILAAIVATASGILTTRWVTQPLLNLNQAAKDIAKGEWNKTIEVERSDEVGELAQSFNKMARQLKESFQNLERLVEERTVQLKKAKEVAENAAMQDKLTGLPNRAFFHQELEKLIRRGQQDKNYLFAVLFLDLDGFKIVNDSLGHQAGDQLLIEMARKAKACLRSEDFIARLGGDEFAILLQQIKGVSDAQTVAERIQLELTQPIHLQEQDVFVSASIGIALSQQGYDNIEDFLRDADIAMYRAKAGGKARHTVFEPSMRLEAQIRLQLENDLRRGIERNQLAVFYQPIVDLSSGRIIGLEALIRWQHPEKGLVSPSEFIPLAEETGLILQIGWSILHTACLQVRQWQEQYPLNLPFSVSVNISAIQFSRADFPEQIGRILEETGLEPQHLNLEITESAIIKNIDRASSILGKLNALGIKVSLDDFGTGYSSLSYLYKLPINTLKIDGSFVQDIESDREKFEVTRTIVNLAHNLGMEVVAEGVETNNQLALLKELNCQYGQGYLFGYAVTSERAEALIAEKVILPFS